MTTYTGAVTDLHPLFAAQGAGDADEARRRVGWEIFSALTEVVSGQGEWSEQSASRIRAEGRTWARRGGSVDELLTIVRTMTHRLINRCTVGGQEQDPLSYEVMVLRLGDAGRRVGRELSCGFFGEGNGAPPVAPVAADGVGRQPGAPGAERLVPGVRAVADPVVHLPRDATDAHAVLAVRAPSCAFADIDRVFREHSAAVVLVAAEGAHVLLPAADQDEAVAVARTVREDLPGDVWIAVHWQGPRPGARAVPDGFGLPAIGGTGPAGPQENGLSVADGICATVRALAGPPDVYVLDDVLVEFGAARTPAVAERLVRMIEPLHEHPVLLETLTALVAADGVRHRACVRLGVHRNTLDRRLQRIGRLTGQRPEGLRGLSTLRAALAVDAVTRLRGGGARFLTEAETAETALPAGA